MCQLTVGTVDAGFTDMAGNIVVGPVGLVGKVKLGLCVVIVGLSSGRTWNTKASVVIHWKIITAPTKNMYQNFSGPWKDIR